MSVDEDLAGPAADDLDQRRRWRPRTAFEERTSPDGVIQRCEGDEPVFVLRAHDGTAVRAIGWYVQLLRFTGQPEAKVDAVIAVARAFKAWPERDWPALDFVTDETAWRNRHRLRTAREELAEADSVLNRARDDEPVFVLRAADPLASLTVLWWAQNAVGSGGGERKYNAALEVAMGIERWRARRRLAPGAVEAKTPPPAETTRPVETATAASGEPGPKQFRILAVKPAVSEVVLSAEDGGGQETRRWASAFIERFALQPGDRVTIDPGTRRAFDSVEKSDGRILGW